MVVHSSSSDRPRSLLGGFVCGLIAHVYLQAYSCRNHRQGQGVLTFLAMPPSICNVPSTIREVPGLMHSALMYCRSSRCGRAPCGPYPVGQHSAVFQPAPEPPRWRRYVQSRTPVQLLISLAHGNFPLSTDRVQWPISTWY